MYNIIGNNNNTTATKNKPTKLTAGSSITGEHTVATIQDSVIQAINQLSANQHTLINQMAVVSFNNASAPPQQYTTPPIQQVNILAHAAKAGATTGEFNAGRGGRGRTGRGRGTGRGGGWHQRTLFANHMHQQGGRGRGCRDGSLVPTAPGSGTVTPPAPQAYQSNLVKNFANWSKCYSCGFDIKDRHTSITFPTAWHRPNHPEGFMRANAQEYINQGWDPCTKAMHKTKFPGFWRGGVENIIAHKCNHLVSAFSLDPTQIINVTMNVVEDDKTIITSNCTSDATPTILAHKNMRQNIEATARHLFGTPLPQYLNEITMELGKTGKYTPIRPF
jgi:hypothetical protein